MGRHPKPCTIRDIHARGEAAATPRALIPPRTKTTRMQEPDFRSPPSSRTAGPLAMPCPADPLTTTPSWEHPGLEKLNVCSTEFDVAAAWNRRGKRNSDGGRDAATDAEMRPRL